MTAVTDATNAPPPFEIDVKIEQTQKGARVTVHCIGSNDEMTLFRAVNAYQQGRERLRTAGEIVAPVESGGAATYSQMFDLL